MGGAATQAVYTCGSPPALSGGAGGGWDGREESGVTSEGPGELDRLPLLLFWDSGDTNTTPSVGVGKGQAGSRKVLGKQKDSSLVIAGIPETRLLKERIRSTASQGFPGGSAVENPPANAGEGRLIPG